MTFRWFNICLQWFCLCKNLQIIYACDSVCSGILDERYGLTTEELYELPILLQTIVQDSIDCAAKDLCPIHLMSIIGQKQTCINGFSSNLKYPCNKVDLLSFVNLTDLGSNVNASGNDIWGYSEYNINETAIGLYVLSGQSDGTSLINITDPINPNVLAFIQSNVYPLRNIIWRDIKVYKNYAFIVSDTANKNDHYLQIFNIQQIIDISKQYSTQYIQHININSTNINITIYKGFGKCHNIFINEESGYLYAVGIKGYNEICDTGLFILDIHDPMNPIFVVCYPNATYIHDIQCVNYVGPDIIYKQHEICFAFTPQTDSFTIIDVTNKSDIFEISVTIYNHSEYSHQGWVTSNHEYLLFGDELDEKRDNGINTQITYIFDIKNLSNPQLINIYDSNITVIDHNQYIIDNGVSTIDNHNTLNTFKGFVFQSDYEAGLRILNIDDIKNGNIYEIAYFDNYIWSDTGIANESNHDTVRFRGAWSTFPFFKLYKNKQGYKDVVAMMSTNAGLYILQINIELNDIFNSIYNQTTTLLPSTTTSSTYDTTLVDTTNMNTLSSTSVVGSTSTDTVLIETDTVSITHGTIEIDAATRTCLIPLFVWLFVTISLPL